MLVKFMLNEVKRLTHFGVWASYMSKFLLGLGIGMLLAVGTSLDPAVIQVYGWVLTMFGLALTAVFLIEIIHQN
jgi:hypothetical protein